MQDAVKNGNSWHKIFYLQLSNLITQAIDIIFGYFIYYWLISYGFNSLPKSESAQYFTTISAVKNNELHSNNDLW